MFVNRQITTKFFLLQQFYKSYLDIAFVRLLYKLPFDHHLNLHYLRALPYQSLQYPLNFYIDLNNDGETSVEEVLQNNYFKISHPDFHEKDKVSLQKYAQKDGNSSVTAEEYAEWLNSEEHKEVLDDFRLIQAEEIKRKRNIN